ncbi:MAG TPA: hypothetical protein VE935_01920 [Burkholderiales bacterium]|nr:hypothetical protein [Burkholderiales bacterium]
MDIGSILHGTPAWVFVLFAALLVLGVQALRTRRVAPWRLLAVPALFIGWGLVTLALRSAAAPAFAAAWGVAALAGIAIGWLTAGENAVRFDLANARVTAFGSPATLIRNLAIFAAKYGLAVAMARAPQQLPALLAWDSGVSGLAAGYFVGWLLRLFARYRSARAAQLQPAI